MSFNWQAYEDGSLSPTELTRHEIALRDDPHAAAELQSMLALRAAVRDVGLSVTVPTERLQGMIKVAGKTYAHVTRAATVLACGAAVLAAAVYTQKQIQVQNNLQNPPVVVQPTPPNLISQVTDPYIAHMWVVSHCRYMAPVPATVVQHAKLTEAMVGKGYFGYSFTYNGETYRLMGRAAPMTTACHTVVINRQTYQMSGDAVMWTCIGNISYSVEGGTEEGRKYIADLARTDTKSASF